MSERVASWRSRVIGFGLILALGIFVYPAFAHAVEVWSTDEEFTYGFLIPPIALAVLWWRRDRLRRSIGIGARGGLLLVVGAILVTLVSRRTGINVLAGLAVSPMLIGMAAYVWGWRAARVVAFPAAFLVFGLGLYRGLLNSIGFALQDLTAQGAAVTARLIGLDVIRDGLLLHSAPGSAPYAFVVAQACSGMSSLLSLLSLAALWIYATRGSLPAKLAVILGVVPLVIVANTLRVSLVLVVASTLGEDAALGFFHGLSSLVLFGLAVTGLLVLSRSVGCKLPPFATSF